MTRYRQHIPLSIVAIGLSVCCVSDAFVPRHALHIIPTRSCPANPRILYTSQRPIDDILLELDARGIKFPPTATRSELEHLLFTQQGIPLGDESGSVLLPQNREDIASEDDFRRSRRKRSLSASRQRRSRRQSSTVESYAKEENMVDREIRRRRRQRRQDRPAPTDVLLRVVDKTSRTVAQVIPERVVEIGSKATRIASRKTQQLLNDLVELTYKDVPNHRRYTSNDVRPRKKFQEVESTFHSQSRAEAIPIKRERRTIQKVTDDVFVKNKVPDDEKQVETDGSYENDLRIPICEILSQLDQRNIYYSPQATRAELEKLLEEQQHVQADAAVSYTVDDETLGQSTIQSRKVDDDRSEENIWRKSSKVASKKAKEVPKKNKVSESFKAKAKNTYHSVSSLFQPKTIPDITAPVIVDAVVEDFSNADWDDDIIDVEPVYRGTWSTTAPKRKSTLGSRDTRNRSARPVSSQERLRRQEQYRKLDVERRKTGTTRSTRPRQSPVDTRGIPRLNPGKTRNDEDEGTEQGRTRRSTTDRRIYSPYRDSSDVYVDGLDRLGDFVVQSVDSFLWGSEKERSSKQSSESSQNTSRTRRSGNWKDRMEEQFDYLLGIHQDGKYYNRWVNDEREEAQNAEGTDAVSYARGRATRSGRKQHRVDKPIWEEEDSLLSLLFGTDKEARKRSESFYRSPSMLGSGSLVKVLRTCLRSATIVASGVCQWASVRGSLPQPVVVVGIISAALSSRPGSRIRNVILALLAIRAVGELLHGYMYDDADFWDPREDDNSSTGEQIPMPDKG